MFSNGVSRVYAKELAPNDNSKNQIYLGGDFSALNVIPHGEVFYDNDQRAGSKRDRAKAKVSFSWISTDGQFEAPNANLILYPKYPEVRMSGFLQGCKQAPSDVLNVRDEGRVLVLGVKPDGTVLGFATQSDHPVAKQIRSGEWPKTGVFHDISSSGLQSEGRSELLARLAQIHLRGWIQSQKLSPTGEKVPYAARNGGGYTLEAELGVTPNAYAGPDFMGWEVKQYGVTDFIKLRAKSPVTLLTPEPSGGLYRELGFDQFMQRFGYPDKNGTPDRVNFGGKYVAGRGHHDDTGLELRLSGYDAQSLKITHLDGYIGLFDRDGNCAASWPFMQMMDHWQRKHAKAAYVPSIHRKPPPEYAFGPEVILCEQTDFLLFLAAVSNGQVYYDPGMKLEKISSLRPIPKRRSQFRIKHSELAKIYERHESVKLV